MKRARLRTFWSCRGLRDYSLLTRWNPLNFERPLPPRRSGHKVLVVGLGPAGFTLAHHLMNDGHAVVGNRRLKDRTLPAEDRWRRRARDARAVPLDSRYRRDSDRWTIA